MCPQSLARCFAQLSATFSILPMTLICLTGKAVINQNGSIDLKREQKVQCRPLSLRSRMRLGQSDGGFSPVPRGFHFWCATSSCRVVMKLLTAHLQAVPFGAVAKQTTDMSRALGYPASESVKQRPFWRAARVPLKPVAVKRRIKLGT